jgi:hypothetical protein
VLVTTDAIAYGLNLSIRRIIFATVKKFDGHHFGTLPVTTVLQVAGRAGRYGRAFGGDRGLVTTLHGRDFDLVSDTLNENRSVLTGDVHHHVGHSYDAHRALQPVRACGLLPTADVLTVYIESKLAAWTESGAQGQAPTFVSIMEEFLDDSRSGRRPPIFFLCDMTRSLIGLANAISNVEMAVPDKVLFCFAPISASSAAQEDDATAFLRRLAIEHGRGGPVGMGLDARIAAVHAALGLQPHAASREKLRHVLDEITTEEDEDEAAASGIELESSQLGLRGSEAFSHGSGRKRTPRDAECLRECESLFRLVEVYGWLGWRFPRTFTDLALVPERKQTLVDLIDLLVRREVDVAV